MTTQIAKYKRTGYLIQPERPEGLQAVFDRVVASSRAQPTQSLNESGECCYRSGGGRRCFVGHMIHDRDYHSEMEGQPAEAVLLALGFDDDEVALLNALQGVHDDHAPSQWEAQLAETALEHDLVYTPPGRGH
jgi:hypothetical protein